MQASVSPFSRILLKLSGESLVGQGQMGIQAQACLSIAASIRALALTGVQIGIVIGGGNLFRGIQGEAHGVSRSAADQMGMLATLMNGIALQQAFASLSCPAVVLTALECPRVAETFTLRKAEEYFQTGHVCIFVGGTGNPYFTTDTAAALRASEIQADALLKATKVDGVYSADPLKSPGAVKYATLSYAKFLEEKLAVMDATAVVLCRNTQTPIFVFQMQELHREGLLQRLAEGQLGTQIRG